MITDVLHSAIDAVSKHNDEYGPPHEMFRIIAERWSLTLGTTVTPEQVAMCMIDLKLARLSRDPSHYDSAVDVAGYAACLNEICEWGKIDMDEVKR